MSCLPVLVLGMGSALAHLLRGDAPAARGDRPSSGPASHGNERHQTGHIALCRETAHHRLLPTRAGLRSVSHGPSRPWRTNDRNPRSAPCPGDVRPRLAGNGRPPARMRIAEARVVAAKVTVSGQRVSRRSLRSAGLRGSNADLGMLARLIGTGPSASEPDPVP